MHLPTLVVAALLPFAATVPLAAAQHAPIDGDKITLTGCVTPPNAQLQMPFETLLWSRAGILTAGTRAAGAVEHADAQDLAQRVLYWIDDDDLSKHVGRMVEVRGKLGKLETGELEIDRGDEFTEIRLELGGDDQKIRVPTAWLDDGRAGRPSRAANRDDDVEIKIATRKVDVDDVKVLGICQGR